MSEPIGRVLAFGLLVLATTLAASPPVAAEVKQPAFSQDAESVKSRLENVRRLVHTSSGARRVKQGDAAAQALQAEAAQHLDAAEQRYDAGNMAGANDELQAATETMFQAIRKVGWGSEHEAKHQHDYDNKRKSLDALLSALDRVGKEKGGDAAAAASASEVRSMAQEADRLAATGRLSEAQSLLDQAYDEVKVAVEKMRGGDTLVRSLDFASPEEEYRYELDRNETHEMLLQVLLEDKQLDARAQQQVDKFVADGRRLRKKAEQEAGAGRYKDAIGTLEQATKELLRAIRSAGVYIPG
jgi:hypothetical protein